LLDLSHFNYKKRSRRFASIMLSSTIETGDIAIGYICSSVVSVVGHVLPSFSEFLN
jgi:hypothetical protein